MDLTSARIVRAFRGRRHPMARRLLVALLLIYGWVAMTTLLSSSHDPSGLQRAAGLAHAEQAAPLSADHGHVHDGGDSTWGDSGHPYGHNPGDHSHDKPNLLRADLRLGPAPVEAWVTRFQSPRYPSPYFAFERPPKPLPQHS